ncbi:MAG TPA: class I SAM-dependent methyltransferase [Solirubrobacter sp.]|nr:class I SAM-dependent methyltransferase [Solirubrobacter sp.]
MTKTAPHTSAAERSTRLPVGVHLVGSVPLAGAEDVFTRAAAALGDRLRRIPDGETGPRSDWILWQYPVFSSRPEFEIGPPGDGTYRTLPKLRLRPGATAHDVDFGSLGYSDAAIASYKTFARLKRDGAIPSHCRFQLSLPTPLAPISAFVDPEFQAALEPVYEARVLDELARILAVIPHEQLAVQWDTRFEFAMLEGVAPAWFSEVRGGILERLLRLSRHVPAGVELGFHLCYGDEAHGYFVPPRDARKLVEVANALSASLGRTLDWIHMPVPRDRTDDAYFAPLADLALQPQTELYLGLIHRDDGEDGALDRIEAARRHVDGFGAATDCGWGRGGEAAVEGLLALHAAVSRPLPDALRRDERGFSWPDGFVPVPDEDWTTQEIDPTALAYDHVDQHGWYSNLDPTVEEIAAFLRDGDVLMDYSGGTGILLDRLRLRIFERPVGWLIVDASAKFLRVALEKYRGDPRVALRLLRFLRDEKRLQRLDEVLPADMQVDAIAAVNAIHLYPDLDEVAAAWVRALKPGGRVFINSGNLRNPRAAAGEWILDETVWVINDLAEGLVRSRPEYAKYRPVLDDEERMKAHAAQRDRVFLKPRPLEYYTDGLTRAGLTITDVREKTIVAKVEEWFELMTAYHDAVLGWVGGTKKLDGRPPTPEAVQDRLTIMRHAIDTIFSGREEFKACWTYITAEK